MIGDDCGVDDVVMNHDFDSKPCDCYEYECSVDSSCKDGDDVVKKRAG